MRRHWWMLAVALAACAGNGAGRKVWPTACWSAGSDVNCRYVSDIVRVADTQEWARTGWFRIGDLPQTPIIVLVTADRQGCVASFELQAVARAQEYWSCFPWRQWQGR